MCPVSIRTDMPLVGKSSSGIVKYNGKIYMFGSVKSATAFVNDPVKYLDKLFELALSKPYLFYLIGISYMLPTGIALQNSKKKQSVDTDTMTGHPLESDIDHSYQFSEWQLRKRALKYADLRTKKTHSTQTHASHFRRENETQVYLPKEKTTQTVKEKGTNPIKTVRYVEGLRGASTQKMKVVTLQFEQK